MTREKECLTGSKTTAQQIPLKNVLHDYIGQLTQTGAIRKSAACWSTRQFLTNHFDCDTMFRLLPLSAIRQIGDFAKYGQKTKSTESAYSLSAYSITLENAAL